MSLHGPAGACIPVAGAVASVSPIHVHVFPIQRVLKHCGPVFIFIYNIHACDPKQS